MLLRIKYLRIKYFLCFESSLFSEMLSSILRIDYEFLCLCYNSGKKCKGCLESNLLCYYFDPWDERWALAAWQHRLNLSISILLQSVAMQQVAAEGQSDSMVSDMEVQEEHKCVTEFFHEKKKLVLTDVRQHWLNVYGDQMVDVGKVRCSGWCIWAAATVMWRTRHILWLWEQPASILKPKIFYRRS